MDTRRLKALCSRFPGATTLLHREPVNVLSYKVGGRTFAYFKTSEPERWRFSIKVTPERFIELTDVAGIKPARFMGRWRWITIVDARGVSDAYLRELVDWSYRDAFARLSRKQQRLLRG